MDSVGKLWRECLADFMPITIMKMMMIKIMKKIIMIIEI